MNYKATLFGKPAHYNNSNLDIVCCKTIENKESRISERAYQVSFAARRSENNSSSGASSGESDINWSEIWNLNLPPKIRLLIWRACRNILPHAVELSRRHVSTNPFCIHCSSESSRFVVGFAKYGQVLPLVFLLLKNTPRPGLCSNSSRNSSKIVGRPRPSDGEALAVVYGVHRALQQGWRRVIVETDCHPVFRYLHQESSFLSLLVLFWMIVLFLDLSFSR